MGTRRRRVCLLIPALLLLPAVVRCESGSRWKVYGKEDGLGGSNTVAVTISPRGNVWARHGGDGGASWLDGFQVRSIPYPDIAHFPVLESRSGQIWSLHVEGVMEYRRGQWIQYPVAEIIRENQTNALRQVRPIPILPAERDHVLVLLPDRLIEYDAAQNRTAILRRAAGTGLGRFTDMVEARDGGAWVTGTHGLAKLPGPVRRLDADSLWQEYFPEASWQIQNVERPLEDDDGGVMAVADMISSTGRVTLRFDGRSWSTPIPTLERTRGAWLGPDESLWAFTRSGLSKREKGQWRTVNIPGLTAPQFSDVATEPNGVFWLATTEGLVRHAPQTWRTPAEIADLKSPVYGIAEDTNGVLWFADEAGLLGLKDRQWRLIPWPGSGMTSPEIPLKLFSLPGGKIVVGGPQPLVFDSNPGRFAAVAHPQGRRVGRFLGWFKEGELCVETRNPGTPDRFRLESFDGEKFQVLSGVEGRIDSGEELVFAHRTGGNELWAGGNSGLSVWDDKAGSLVPVKGFRGSATCLLELGGGKLWCAGGSVISEFDGRNWSMIRSGLGRINSLLKVRDGSIWVATDDGAYRYAEGSWMANGIEEGLPGQVVHELRQDGQGTLWAATAGGVCRYERAADTDPPLSILPASENPNELSAAAVASVRFGGRDKWDFTKPDRLLFSHRLDEAPWSALTTNTSAQLTNLSAGKHRFTVRAVDRNWNEEAEPSLYEFVAVMPWYSEPRLLIVGLGGLVIAFVLGWLALNRHFRVVRAYAEVEKIVAQRTSELERANRELLHSQKMRALGTLAAGIAHDFNNILSIIKGSAQIIEGNLEDREKIRTRIRRIRTMVDQGSGIVKAMLGFSRVGEQQEKPCDVNQVIADVSKLLGDQYRHEVVLRLDPGASLPTVKGGSELIQQMLLNLIHNAADSMAGRGEVLLRTGRLERLPRDLVLAPVPAERYVFIAVGDSGCGIAPEVLSRIFEPFFTTKALSSRRGTGLGLSMVYEIAKEMGFGLTVESTEGKGSTFTIVLPVGPAATGRAPRS